MGVLVTVGLPNLMVEFTTVDHGGAFHYLSDSENDTRKGRACAYREEEPLGAARWDKVEPAFKEEENVLMFEDIIDSWKYRIIKAIAKGLG